MKKQEVTHPVTVEEHRNLGRIHAEKKITAVNDALNFPTGDAFEKEISSILECQKRLFAEKNSSGNGETCRQVHLGGPWFVYRRE